MAWLCCLLQAARTPPALIEPGKSGKTGLDFFQQLSIGPFMPSLIRFLIVILFLGGLVLGTMVALPIFVEPQHKEVTVKVPARDLFGDD